MAKSPKKFSIPLMTEDDESINQAPKYFKVGKILEAAENETKTSDAHTESNASNKNNDLGSNSKDNPKDEMQTTTKQPLSRFESEFAHLRSSKYYDNALESAASASETTEEKPVDKSRSTGAILVSSRQRGNPLLKHIRNVPWEYSEIEPDYVIGKIACALFLSLRYHNLFPNYIHERLKALGKSYSLRVLLVQVDVVEPSAPLKDLSVIAILADCTLMVAWSPEEAGTYLETYKMFENKSADLIKEKQDDDNYSQLIDCLTAIRSINKTDAMVLLSTFKTLKGIIQASVDDLAMCPGIGPLKAKRLYDALRKPLANEQKKK